MASDTENYRAYLLRFWRRDETQPWRVTIHCVATQEQQHFATVAEAFAFLQGQLALGEAPQLKLEC